MLETKTNKWLHEFVAERMFGNYEEPGGLEKAPMSGELTRLSHS